MELEQRTAGSLLNTAWTRRTDGLAVEVREVFADPHQPANADTALIICAQRGRHWSISYNGLASKYREDSRTVGDELTAIAHGLDGSPGS